MRRHGARTILCAAVLVTLLAPPGVSAEAQDPYLWCWDRDEVRAWVEAGTLVIAHEATIYNCCPDPFEYEVSVEGDLIRVREIEVLTEPCYCICCFDLAMTIEGLAPGDYALEFSWYDYEIEEWVARWLEVSMPDDGQAGLPQVGETYSSGCIESQSVPEAAEPETEEPSLTWGRIKSFFE